MNIPKTTVGNQPAAYYNPTVSVPLGGGLTGVQPISSDMIGFEAGGRSTIALKKESDDGYVPSFGVGGGERKRRR